MGMLPTLKDQMSKEYLWSHYLTCGLISLSNWLLDTCTCSISAFYGVRLHGPLD